MVRAGDSEAHAALVRLEGGLAATRCWGTPFKRGLPLWSRFGAGRADPVLLPRLPEGERLVERWRTPGVGVWLSDGLTLVEAPGGALVAHDPSDGRVLWERASIRSSLSLWQRGEGPEELEDERTSTLSWAVAPWGAVEVLAHYEAPLQRRRVGRWHGELGRVTESQPVDRGATHVDVSAQVLVADSGGWPANLAPPESIVERAGAGEPLAGSSMVLGEWFEELNALSLDPGAPSFAVCWGVPSLGEEWAVFDVAYGVVGPSSWEADGDDPFQTPVPPACPGPPGTVFRVHGERLRHEAGGELLADYSLEGLSSPQLIAADGAVLIAGFRGRTIRLLRLDWESEGPRSWPERWPASFDGRVRLVGWDALPGNADLCGQLLVAGGLLYVQEGSDSLVAYGPEPA